MAKNTDYDCLNHTLSTISTFNLYHKILDFIKKFIINLSILCIQTIYYRSLIKFLKRGNRLKTFSSVSDLSEV